MRPIFEALGERVGYELIRLVTAHLEAVGADTAPQNPR
jgi:hypothetical protein